MDFARGAARTGPRCASGPGSPKWRQGNSAGPTWDGAPPGCRQVIGRRSRLAGLPTAPRAGAPCAWGVQRRDRQACEVRVRGRCACAQVKRTSTGGGVRIVRRWVPRGCTRHVELGAASVRPPGASLEAERAAARHLGIPPGRDPTPLARFRSPWFPASSGAFRARRKARRRIRRSEQGS